MTGTDTGVGKTVVSAILCAALDAIYWKPIQTGPRLGTNRETVMQLAELSRKRTLRESYGFPPPVSPHLASRRAGVCIDLRRIQLPEIAKLKSLVVEGAGVLVPLNDRQFMTLLIAHLKLPVVLVSRSSLGTINHTLLSLAALRAAAITGQGVVAVGQPNFENRKAIEQYGEVQVIGIVPLIAELRRSALLKIYSTHIVHEVLAKWAETCRYGTPSPRRRLILHRFSSLEHKALIYIQRMASV